MIRVLLAEDQHLIRGALMALIGLEEDMQVVAELDRGDAIVTAATRVRPDVAVLDIDLPGLDGLSAARVCGDWPNRRRRCRRFGTARIGAPSAAAAGRLSATRAPVSLGRHPRRRIASQACAGSIESARSGEIRLQNRCQFRTGLGLSSASHDDARML